LIVLIYIKNHVPRWKNLWRKKVPMFASPINRKHTTFAGKRCRTASLPRHLPTICILLLALSCGAGSGPARAETVADEAGSLSAALRSGADIPARREAVVRYTALPADLVDEVIRAGVTVERRTGNDVDFRLSARQREILEGFLAGRGIKTEAITIVEDTATWVEEMLGPGGKGTYHEYTDLLAEMLQLAADYPAIARLDTLGESIQGRKILLMKISDNVGVDETEAEVFFDGATHGDEWIAEEVALFLINHLLENYGSDPVITNLVNHREIFVVPMLNPDGVTSRSRYNAAGVDLNRDYGYQWEGWGGSGGPFSQPEIKAVWSFHHEHRQCTSVSFHSGIEYISMPWSYHPDATMDDAHYRHLSSGYSSSSGYPYGQGYHGMYEIHGSSKDTFYGCVGAIGWTIEVSVSKTPSSSQIEYYCEKNRLGMLYLAENAGKGVMGIVTDADTGEPLPAVVNVLEIDWPVFADPENGDYHKFLLPGTYTLHIQAPGHAPATIENVVVGSGEAVQVDAALEADGSGGFAYRTISCNIADPGSAHTNHSLTPWSLGFPDGVSASIGVGGWIVQDLGDGYEAIDLPGYDFTVYEGDASAEGYSVYAGNNCHGPWTFIGAGNGTSNLDLDGTGLSSVRYIKIVDDGDGNPSASDAGMELDAIVAASQPEGPCLSISDREMDDSLGGNGNGVIEAGEMVDFDLTLINNGLADAENVYGVLSTNDIYATVRRSAASFGNIASDGTGSGASTFKVKVADECPNPHYVSFTLDIYADGGYESASTFNEVVGAPGFQDDMEGTVEGWDHYAVTSGYYDEWHVSTARSHGGSRSWKCGDTGAGDYSNFDDSGLVTPPVLISDGASLSFWHWIDAELDYGEYAWDGAIVEASTNGGASFVQIFPEGGYPYKITSNDDSPFQADTPCFSGSFPWSEEVFQLGSLTGEALFRFRFGTDGYVTEEGWYIDDVSVDVPLPAVSCDITEDSDLIHWGEYLGYTISLENNTGGPETVQVRTDLWLPDGNPYPGNPILGPASITLPGGAHGSRHFTNLVPAGAPAGFYSYRVTIEQGGSELDLDAFQFEVAP